MKRLRSDRNIHPIYEQQQQQQKKMTKSSTVILHLRFPQSLLLLQQLLLLLFINFSVLPIDAFANTYNNNNNNDNIQQQQQQQSQKRSTAAAAVSSSSSSSSASSLVRASVRASASVRLIEEDDDSLSLSLSKNDDISNNDSNDKDKDSIIDYSSSRRRWMYQTQQKFATTAAALTVVVALPSSTKAAYGSSVEEEKEDSTTTTTTTTTRNTSTRNTNSNTKIGVVTDKVYVDIAGLGIQSESESSAEISKTQRIVFGLFGDDSPNSVNKIKQLFNSKVGLPAECKPLKKDFLIQREQLEANKVYRSCVEGVESNSNVNYLYSQIWRIIQNDRIDFGSVSGKFISREFPTWNENENKNDNEDEDNGESDGFANTAKKITEYTSQPTIHYLMAVRRGNDSGFGFTVFPTENLMNNQDFLDNYIVIGKVCESTDSIIQQINNVSVVSTSKKINYGGIVGGKNKKNAPDKSCRYGGPMYCNENKPLKKLTMFRTGIESMDAVLYL